LQGSNGETDIKKRVMDMGRGEERGDVWRVFCLYFPLKVL